MTEKRSNSKSDAANINLSVAIPLFNEETVLPELHRRLTNVLDNIPGGPHEIIFVDDGSSDATRDILSALAVADTRVRAVLLSRNFGHQAALTAAIDHVTGDAVVLMDGDLQDTPETIPQFVDEFQRGSDVVYAIRQKRKESLWMRTAYAAFYATIGKLSDVNLPSQAGDFSLLSKRVVEHLKRMPERHRYLRGLRAWVGYRQTGIAVERDARHSGVSKYSLPKLFQLAFDGIFSFSSKPIRAAIYGGALAMIGSIGFVAYAVVSHLVFASSPPGYTTLVAAMTFLTGIQLFFLGTIGEYVGRIYEQVKRRPLYVVDSVMNTDNVQLTESELWSQNSQQTPAARANATTFPNEFVALPNEFVAQPTHTISD